MNNPDHRPTSTEPANTRVPWSFWVIGLIGLLWNIGGAANYIMQTNPEMVTQMPASHQAIINGRPAWATGGFAIGVFLGALGCLMLLLRRTIATPILLVSLIGIVVTVVHTIMVSTTHTFTTGELVIMAAMPVLVGIALWSYAVRAGKRFWLR